MKHPLGNRIEVHQYLFTNRQCARVPLQDVKARLQFGEIDHVNQDLTGPALVTHSRLTVRESRLRIDAAARRTSADRAAFRRPRAVKVLETMETPGLGSKVSEPAFIDQFIGQDLGSLKASMQAGKDLVIGQDPDFSACGSAMGSGSGGAMGTAHLVR